MSQIPDFLSFDSKNDETWGPKVGKNQCRNWYQKREENTEKTWKIEDDGKAKTELSLDACCKIGGFARFNSGAKSDAKMSKKSQTIHQSSNGKSMQNRCSENWCKKYAKIFQNGFQMRPQIPGLHFWTPKTRDLVKGSASNLCGSSPACTSMRKNF